MTVGSEGPIVRRRRDTLRRIAFAMAGLVLLALIVAWLARKPIAADLIDRTLARAHVPVRYRIADLGLGRQRLVDVVIGNTANPDLVADWVELGTRIGLDGVRVTAVRAGRVRVRGRIVDGRVSLGAIDRLLPASSGRPFALPAIDLDVADARMRLATPQGIVGLRASGAGRIDGGFRGSVAAVGPRLASGGCAVDGAVAVLAVSVDAGRPTLRGPVRAAAVRCGATSLAAPRGDIEVTLGGALEQWSGSATVAAGALRDPRGTLASVAGNLTFDGTRAATRGSVALTGGSAQASAVRAGGVSVAGAYAVAGDAPTFDGRVTMRAAALPASAVAQVAALARSTEGSPVAPLAAQLARALGEAARDFDGYGDVRYAAAGLSVSRGVLTARSGARAVLAGGRALTVDPRGAVALDGTIRVGGGGLPEANVALRRTANGALAGTAHVEPYRAEGALLTLSPIVFEGYSLRNDRQPASANAPVLPRRREPSLGPRLGGDTMRRSSRTHFGNATWIVTTATLSGPLPGGGVDRLTLPLDVRLAGGMTMLNPGCAPVAFQRFTLSGLVLAPARLALCPLDGAMLRVAGGRISGGVRIAATQLSGRIGSSPLSLAAADATVRLADRGFVVDRLATKIGAAGRQTRLDFARLEGRVTPAGLGGEFAGGAGQVGNVALLLSDAAGAWRFAHGTLALDGALAVADSAADPRFKSLAARGVALTLADNAIRAGGALYAPDHAAKIADVTLVHDLASGRGSADLTVPALVFDKDFQPDRLTRLTFGVIADVAGTITGAGHIAWSPDGVTSTGRFATAGTDLAAAFGPVSGIAGTIAFTDLLNLQSAPDQVATVRTINPGIPVENGTITYQLLPGARVQVAGGRWPFAGGTLVLEPTLLDFSAATERRMTFRVAGMDAQRFLAQFDFKNLDASGTFDGVLPMVFDAGGGRIEGGHLIVRAGGGGIAYVGDLSQKDLGLWGNIAFQALKSLKYRSLTIDMNGPLAGEMVTQVRFAGISQGAGAKSNFLVRRLQRLPFVFNVTIHAPFRGLIDTAQSFYDPKKLIERNLPTLLEEQEKQAHPPPVPLPVPPPVQPPASGTVPQPKQD